MKKFFSKYLEIILIAVTILFLMIKPRLAEYGERISMIMFGTLSFYYLASGFLVFLDKYRITRIMRLIYMAGLWAISVMVIGIMARTLLIRGNEELILISVSSATGILLFSRIYSGRLEDREEKKMFAEQMQPLLIRSIAAIGIGVAFYILSPYSVYYSFGTHRNDPVYIEKVINAYEHPADTLIRNDLERYQEKFYNTLQQQQAPPSK